MEFRSIIKLAFAAGGSQIIALLGYLILPIVYGPTSFGVFAIFMSFAAIGASITTMRFELAFAVQGGIHQASKLLLIVVPLIVLTSLVFSLLSEAFTGLIPSISEIDSWVWVLALWLYVLTLSLQNILRAWLILINRYSLVLYMMIALTSLTLIAQLSLGTAFPKEGLILGCMVGGILIVPAFLLCRSAYNKYIANLDERINFREMLYLNREFPKYTFHTSFLNALSVSVIPIVFAYFFGAEFTGLFFLASKLVGVPVLLLMSSVWPMVHKKIPELDRYGQGELIANIHRRIVTLWSFMFVVISCFCVLMDEHLKGSWSQLGFYVWGLSFVALFRSVSNCSSYFVAFGMQKIESIWNIGLLLTISVAVLFMAGLEESEALVFYVVVLCLFYFCLNLYWGFQLNVERIILVNWLRWVFPSLCIGAGLVYTESWVVMAMVLICSVFFFSWIFIKEFNGVDRKST